VHIRILQSGDDVALVIPRSVADAARLEPGGVVDASVQDGKLIVAPADRPRYTLEELLAGVTDENRHGEISTGPAVGEEVW
jgi:antitoxin MazE